MIRKAPWLLEWVDGDRREPVEPPQTVHKWTPSRPVTARTALRCTALQPTLPCGYEASRWAAVGCCGRCSGAWVGGFRLFSGCLVCGVSSNWKGGRAGHPASQSRKGQAEVAGTPYMCVMDVTLCRRGGPMGPELRHTAPLSAQPGCHLASTWCSPSCTVYFCSLSSCP